MESWKQAYFLSLFELKHSKKSFFMLFVILIMALIFIVPVAPDYFINASLGLDFTFIIAFTIVSQWARPKDFRILKQDNHFWASTHLIMLNQLAISKEVIIKHRFITYFMFSIPFQLLLLASIYALTPVFQDAMSIGNYIVFSIIWLSINIYIGSSQVVSEAGMNMVRSIILSLLLYGPLFLIVFTFLFYKTYLSGFVHWTIFIATNYPGLSIITSLILAVISLFYFYRRMQRQMDTYDYL